jgi:hypothetical protein
MDVQLFDIHNYVTFQLWLEVVDTRYPHQSSRVVSCLADCRLYQLCLTN